MIVPVYGLCVEFAIFEVYAFLQEYRGEYPVFDPMDSKSLSYHCCARAPLMIHPAEKPNSKFEAKSSG